MTTTLLDRADSASSPSRRPSGSARRRPPCACRFTWFGVRKTLTTEQKSQAAEPFGAEGDFLSARKKLLDTKHAAYKEVTAVRGKVVSLLAVADACPTPNPAFGSSASTRSRASTST